jgi:hypothetical protein
MKRQRRESVDIDFQDILFISISNIFKPEIFMLHFTVLSENRREIIINNLFLFHPLFYII